MMTMSLVIAALLALQAKTVEDRLKELDEKIASLEKKQQTLADENASLEKKLADAKAWREKAAAGWTARLKSTLSLTDPQAAAIEALWIRWTREDQEKRADEAAWKAREGTLRATLTPEQGALLDKTVRGEAEGKAKAIITVVAKQAGIESIHLQAFTAAVLSRVSLEGAGLLTQGNLSLSSRVRSAVEASLPDLPGKLSDEELQRLRKIVKDWAQVPKEK